MSCMNEFADATSNLSNDATAVSKRNRVRVDRRKSARAHVGITGSRKHVTCVCRFHFSDFLNWKALRRFCRWVAHRSFRMSHICMQLRFECCAQLYRVRSLIVSERKFNGIVCKACVCMFWWQLRAGESSHACSTAIRFPCLHFRFNFSLLSHFVLKWMCVSVFIRLVHANAM